ncbi:MAG: putative hydro-lyase [Nocardioidaceae bacterium]
MSEVAELSPADVRTRIRSGGWRGMTTGAALGHVQANLVVLPEDISADFTAMCERNPRALPLLEHTAPGVPDRLVTAPGADLRTDLASYDIHHGGVRTGQVGSLDDHWRDHLVAFVLGCSFSAENRLLEAGVRLRHLELGQGVPMYVTSLECTPVGPFNGPIVVSMRPIRRDQVDRAVEVTEALPLAHGAPLQVGEPEGIGIADLAAPDWGDAIEPAADEVPVFWACGVTPQAIIRTVRPEFAITHTPGHMFVTDLLDHEIVGRTSLPDGRR